MSLAPRGNIARRNISAIRSRPSVSRNFSQRSYKSLVTSSTVTKNVLNTSIPATQHSQLWKNSKRYVSALGQQQSVEEANTNLPIYFCQARIPDIETRIPFAPEELPTNELMGDMYHEAKSDQESSEGFSEKVSNLRNLTSPQEQSKFLEQRFNLEKQDHRLQVGDVHVPYYVYLGRLHEDGRVEKISMDDEIEDNQGVFSIIGKHNTFNISCYDIKKDGPRILNYLNLRRSDTSHLLPEVSEEW
eukprot:gb/GECH01003443.1/.p1 GENE.gb/GECH01003443.1/~~gb/GECH01003443.1/.p1  ORF type:complete len:245 (+),score=56.64 gb/GECH01003443.1/:1-735(+)